MSDLMLKKKPVGTDGLLYTGENADELLAFGGGRIVLGEAGTLIISTKNGDMEVAPGDIVISDDGGASSIPTEVEAAAANCAQPSMEKQWLKKQRDEAPASDWAVPSKKKLRIDDAKHVKLAWDMVDRTFGLTDEERKTARMRILARAKKLGVDTSTWNMALFSKESIAEMGVVMEGDAAAAKTEVIGSVPVGNYLITHVIEEASEVVWAFSKAQRYGLTAVIPGTQESVRAAIVQELAELSCCIGLLNDELVEAGVAPITVTESDLAKAKEERLAILKLEYELGRYSLPSDAE